MGALLCRKAEGCRECHSHARWGAAMKTDADSREKEALQWAIDYFHKMGADELKPRSLQGREDEVRGFLLLYDSPIPERRNFFAALIERGDPLPRGIVSDFIAEFLRNPEKPNL